MVRLAILDQDGKHVTPQSVPTAKELLALVEQARNLIRDCERLARQVDGKSGDSTKHQVPYLS
jgi:hypothetical protein